MKKRAWFVWLVGVLLGCLITACASGPGGSDQPGASSNSVSIDNKGSDTMVNLALAWAEEYQKERPEMRISVTGGGSGIGLAALANLTTDIANASRAIKPEELAQAKQSGADPKEFVVARDAIAVIVNPHNPVSRLTLDQISLIYRGKISNWREVGGEDRPIVRLSRESNSGTHVYFLETVIRMGNSKDKSLFSPDTLLLPSSEGIIAEVSSNPNAIGYDGLGYITAGVKTLGIAKKPGEAYIQPSVASVNDKTYSISRDLYMYTPNEPKGNILEYLNWIRSDKAQQIVTQLGFVPILGAK